MNVVVAQPRLVVQEFNGVPVEVPQVIDELKRRFEVRTARHVFVRAYKIHHGAQAFKSRHAFARVARDLREYCQSAGLLAPYYVLRVHAFPDA